MKYHIFGGGTVSHVRPHLALCAPAYGGTARRIRRYIRDREPMADVRLHLTKMASPDSELVTNDDVKAAIFKIMADPEPCVIFMSAALCDFDGHTYENIQIGKLTDHDQKNVRLKTSDGNQALCLRPAQKIISEIRHQRKDIFVVGFKTTTDVNEKGMFTAGLNLLKTASCNLVLVNDLMGDRRNMIVTPEVAPYGQDPFDREKMLGELVTMTMARAGLTFNRTKVLTASGGFSKDRPLRPWREAPTTLQKVVDYCVEQGAYKPFNDVTVGHFGYRDDIEREPEGYVRTLSFWSSRRKKNFNLEKDRDLVHVVVDHTTGSGVIAFGAKPSAGARSQAQVFEDNPYYDCIIHFHCHAVNPLQATDGFRVPVELDDVPRRPQRDLECGSLECGLNTSKGMEEFKLIGQYEDGTVDTALVKAVMLEKHGPNILFRSTDSPDLVIEFIKRNFTLDANTSEYL